jgi:hypothetical protein
MVVSKLTTRSWTKCWKNFEFGLPTTAHTIDDSNSWKKSPLSLKLLVDYREVGFVAVNDGPLESWWKYGGSVGSILVCCFIIAMVMLCVVY